MKRLRLKILFSLLIIVPSVSSAATIKEFICLMEDDGGCRIELPIHVASEYFDKSTLEVTIEPTERVTDPNNPQQGFDDFGPDPYNPSLAPKPKAQTFFENALESFRDRCGDTIKAYRLKAYRLKEKKVPFSILSSDAEFCSGFKGYSLYSKGQVVRGTSKLTVKIPPGAQVHFIDLKAPVGKKLSDDVVVAQSAFQRACALINARLLSDDQVYFSYCRIVGSYNYLSDSEGIRETYGKRVVFFSTPEFDPSALPIIIGGGLAREDLKDPNFHLQGTSPEFFPLWEPPFDGGQRIDLRVEFDAKSSNLVTIKTIEAQKEDAAPYKSSWESIVEEDINPVLNVLGAARKWLQEKQKKSKK